MLATDSLVAWDEIEIEDEIGIEDPVTGEDQENLRPESIIDGQKSKLHAPLVSSPIIQTVLYTLCQELCMNLSYNMIGMYLYVVLIFFFGWIFFLLEYFFIVHILIGLAFISGLIQFNLAMKDFLIAHKVYCNLK